MIFSNRSMKYSLWEPITKRQKRDSKLHILMLFSSDRPVTKNLVINTKCQLKFLLSFISKKEEAKLSSSLVEMKRQQKL